MARKSTTVLGVHDGHDAGVALVRDGKVPAALQEERPKKIKELPMVSIIVPNYNGKCFLDGCLSSLSQIDYPSSRYEVIMVDNGSANGSVEYVRKEFPWVKILALDKNYGFTGGNNRGARIASGDLLVFLNNDTVVNKNWLDELVKVILSDEKIGICGSKIVFMDKPDVVQYAGGFLHLLGGTLFYPIHEDRSKRNFYFVGSICGASFLIKKSIFEDIGGFDEDFFAYSDENDLCLRAWIHGYHVAYSPRSVVCHFARGTSRRSDIFQFNDILDARLISPLTIYHGNKNSIASIVKNFELRNLLLGVVFSLLYCTLQLIFLLKSNAGEGTKLLLKACVWPVRNLKTIWRKRLTIQRKRKLSDHELMEKELLLSTNNLLGLIMQHKKLAKD